MSKFERHTNEIFCNKSEKLQNFKQNKKWKKFQILSKMELTNSMKNI